MGPSHRPNIKKFSTPSRTPVAGTAPHHNSKALRPSSTSQEIVRSLRRGCHLSSGQAGIRGDRLPDTEDDPFLAPPASTPRHRPRGLRLRPARTGCGNAPSGRQSVRTKTPDSDESLATHGPAATRAHFYGFIGDNGRLAESGRRHGGGATVWVQLRRAAGEGKTKRITVTLVRWTSLEEIVNTNMSVLPSGLSAGQARVLPVFPARAVGSDRLAYLRICQEVFLNLPPNNTAISTTLEEVLDDMGYKLSNRNALRRRFGNALEWYSAMRDLTAAKIDAAISTARESLAAEAPETPRAADTPLPCIVTSTKCTFLPYETKTTRYTPTGLLTTFFTTRVTIQTPPASGLRLHLHRLRRLLHLPLPEERTRPSEYLRWLCPACFGGKWENPSMKIAGIVAGDACFTQRRNIGNGCMDPAHQHPSSVFVSTEVTDAMDAYVESIRPSTTRGGSDEDGEPEDDHFEDPRLPVPKSVLDECESSFVAADERRIKSSTRFLTTPGSWLSPAGTTTLYSCHLPRNFVVGFLYDIVCQLERSLRKWNFFPPEYMERMEFAVSVLPRLRPQLGLPAAVSPSASDTV
ncbi:hypothetical protein R3P38DRAFT_3181911, partial [Favolaschia claudopus]